MYLMAGDCGQSSSEEWKEITLNDIFLFIYYKYT